jgi:uncharacterized protein (TIGR03067 family)
MTSRRILLLLITVIGLIVYSGCQKKNPASPVTAGPTELEGVWNGYSDADTADPNIPKSALTYSFTNNNVVVTRDSCSKQDLPSCLIEFFRGTFSVDTNSTPKTLDIHITQSSRAQYRGATIFSIYYKNMNTLTISANGPGSPRPQTLDEAMSVHLTE